MNKSARHSGHPEPRVKHHRQILTWPLSLRGAFTGRQAFETVSKHLTGAASDNSWIKIENRLHHKRPTTQLVAEANAPTSTAPLDPTEYAEYVYFFPFMQSILFDDPNSIHLFRRTDIAAVQIDLDDGDRVTLRVDRIALHLFQTGDAVFVAEFSTAEPDEAAPAVAGYTLSSDLSLAQSMLLNERLRHAYPPFFLSETDGQPPQPGQSVQALTWITNDGAIRHHIAPQWEDMVKSLSGDPPHPPMAQHWINVLPDITPLALRWVHILDDRMPTMAYLQLDDPTQLTDSDWVRLGELDPAGAGWPYARAFHKEYLVTKAYDRFWDPAAGMETRYLCSGYSFVVVTKAGGDFTKLLADHIRGIYFQMALFSHFQLAALQSLSHRMAHAINLSRMDDRHLTDNRGPVDQILRDMLTFSQTSWFPDLTNQVQGKELYHLWRSQLEIDAVYAEVNREAKEVNAFLDRLQDERTAQATERFNWIAAIGVTLGVTVGFLGANIIIPNTGENDWSNTGQWGAALFVLAAVLLIPLAVFGGRAAISRQKDTQSEHAFGYLFLATVAISVLGYVLITP